MPNFDYGKKQAGGGLSRAKKAQMEADDATSLARYAKEERNPILSRAMGDQAKRRGAEARSTAREARANALRRY